MNKEKPDVSINNRPILTIAIPCYNSEKYMDRAIRSTLIPVNGIEVIIVDDGSTDKTAEKADSYQRQYPDQIRVIHQENGGHGDAVMTGLKNARGLYYKVLDSDDWLSRKALMATVGFLTSNAQVEQYFDMLICDYVYEKVGVKRKRRVNYKQVMPVRTTFTWSSIGRFKPWENILMHSVIYRTELLHKCKLDMPKHTFYVDNIYVYHPLPYVKSLYYLDVDLYHYYIGRNDQSVNEQVMMGRIDQQLLVTRLLIEDHSLRNIENRKLRRYMSEYLAVMMAVSTAFLIKIGTKESLAKRDELWSYLKNEYPIQYKYVNHRFLGHALQMKSFLGERIIKLGYEVAQKMMGFN